MDPRELHRETVRLIKVMQNIKDSDMGLSIKRSHVKKLKKELLTMWVDNKYMIPMTNIPSTNIVMSIAQGYDQKHNTNFQQKLFSDIPSEYSMSEYSEGTSEAFSEYFNDTMSELTV